MNIIMLFYFLVLSLSCEAWLMVYKFGVEFTRKLCCVCKSYFDAAVLLFRSRSLSHFNNEQKKSRRCCRCAGFVFFSLLCSGSVLYSFIYLDIVASFCSCSPSCYLLLRFPFACLITLSSIYSFFFLNGRTTERYRKSNKNTKHGFSSW